MKTISRTILTRVSALGRDEAGTTLTEFIIILPVFVMIFSASIALSKYQHVGIEAQIRASAGMWDQAIAIQTNDPNGRTATGVSQRPQTSIGMENEADLVIENHMSLGDAANHAVSTQLSARAHEAVNAASDGSRWSTLGGSNNGVMSESHLMVNSVSSYVLASDNFGLGEYTRITSSHSRYEESQLSPTPTLNGIMSANRKTARFKLLADGLENAGSSLPSNPSHVDTTASYRVLSEPTANAFNRAYDNGRGLANDIGGDPSRPSRLVAATGMRYGLAHGLATVAVNHALVPQSEVKANFYVLAAPKPYRNPNEQLRTNSIAHMTLMGEQVYSTLRGIEIAQRVTYGDAYE